MALRWTDQELAAYEARKGRKASALSMPENASQGPNAAQEIGKRRGVMNKWEACFEEEVLWPEKLAGGIKDYKYESIRFRLADGAWYCPDFVIWHTGTLRPVQVVEVKGHVREAGMVRIKVAAELYPEFEFVMAFRKQGKWEYRYF